MPDLRKYCKPNKYRYTILDKETIVGLLGLVFLVMTYFGLLNMLSLLLSIFDKPTLPPWFLGAAWLGIPLGFGGVVITTTMGCISEAGLPEIKYYYHLICHWKSNKKREKMTQEMYDLRDEATVAWSKGNTKKFDRLIKRHTVIKTKVYDKFY